MSDPRCPFCGYDPYHYVDIGVGWQAVAVTCCNLGIGLFQYNDKKLRQIIEFRRSPSPKKKARAKRMLEELTQENC